MNLVSFRLSRRIVTLISLCAALLFCGGCDGEDDSDAQSTSAPTVPAAVISSFTATPISIVPGQVVTLTWNVSGATTIKIDPGVGAVAGTSIGVTPAVTSTYTLTATNSAGASVTSSLTVTVSPGPSVSAWPTPPPPRVVKTSTKFGISYEAPGFSWLSSHYRYSFVQREVDRDFAIMTSLAVETIKYPYDAASAFVFSPNAGARLRTAAAVSYEPMADDMLKYAPELLQRSVDAGIQPVVCFMTNTFYTMGPNGLYTNPGPAWYEYAYKEGPGYGQMARDIADWESGLMRVILKSPASDHLFYVNLSTEMPAPNLGPDYTALLYPQADILPRTVPVPASKLAMDPFVGVFNPYTGHFLMDEAGTQLFQRLAADGSPLAFTEIHLYPDAYCDAYPGYPAYVPGVASPELIKAAMEESIVLMRELLAESNPPGITTEVVIGESGASYLYFQTQEAQADAFVALWNGAQGAKAFFYGWGFWDNYTLGDPYGIDPGRLGFGFSPDEPRDILGRAVEMRSDLPGGDFETNTSGWIAGHALGSGATLSWFGGERGDAATGLHCLRLTVTKPGLAWISSPPFGLIGRRAALSAYVRTNAATYSANLYTSRKSADWNPVPLLHSVATDAVSLQMALAAYRWETPPLLPPYFDSTNTWRFFQLQNLTPGFYFDLPAEVNGAVLCFWTDAPAGTSETNPVKLDVDTVSIHGFSALSTAAVPAAVRGIRGRQGERVDAQGRERVFCAEH